MITLLDLRESGWSLPTEIAAKLDWLRMPDFATDTPITAIGWAPKSALPRYVAYNGLRRSRDVLWLKAHTENYWVWYTRTLEAP